MKTVKVNHVLLGLKVAPDGGGFTQAEIDDMVNKRLAEGYDDVEVFPVRSNFDVNHEVKDYVQLYIFRKYAEEAPAKASKKADA